MRATRAYLAGLGTAGTLVLAASIMFVFGSAIVTYNGWPKLGGIGSPATQTLTAHPKPGSPHASHGLASVKVVKAHAGAAGVPASVANKRRTLLAQTGRGTASHRSAQHGSSATISHPVAGHPTHSSTPTKTGSGSTGSGSGSGGSGSGSGGSGSGSGGSGSGATTGTTPTVPVVSTPTPATPTTPVSTSSGGGSGGQSNQGNPVVKTGSGTVVVTVPSSSGSRPTGTPVISGTGSSGSSSSSSSSGGSAHSTTTSSSTTTTSSSTTTTSSSTSSTPVTIPSPTNPGGRGPVGGPIFR